MSAPTGNTNARKGKINRVMWSGRIPTDTYLQIKVEASRLGISESDVVGAWGKIIIEKASGNIDELITDVLKDEQGARQCLLISAEG